MASLKNFAVSAVATAPSPAASGTSLVVTSGQGARFSAKRYAVIAPSGASPDSTNAEVVFVSAISTDTLTLVRTQQGTSARTVGTGDQIFQFLSADEITGAEQWFISRHFDGQGNTLEANAGAGRFRSVRKAGQIRAVTLVGDQSGSVTVTAKKYTPSAGAPGSPTTLGTASLSSATHSRTTGLTWDVSAGDLLEIIVGGVTSLTALDVLLEVEPA